MHTFRCAFRHDNGQIEGFTGYGFGDYGAKQDCLEQIRRKLSIIPRASHTVDENRMIFSKDELTPEEVEAVFRDWASGLRYAPDGYPWANRDRGSAGSGF